MNTHIIKITIILLISITNCENLIAQSVNYFNYRYDLSQTGEIDRSYCIIEADSNYVMAGYNLNYSTNKWDIVLSSYNQQGGVEWIKSFGDNISNYFLGDPGCLLKYDQNTYYSVGLRRKYTSNYVHDEIALSKYNRFFDTIWSKYYGEQTQPYDTAYIFHQLKLTYDNSLILGGEWKPAGEPIRMCLIKTDSSGDMLWKQSYGSGSGYYRGFSVIQTSDNGYALGGFLFYIGQDESGDPIVVKTDSLGNQQWMKNLGGEFPDHKAMLAFSVDSNILVGTCYGDSMINNDVAYARINMIKLNNDGDILWNKKYGSSTPDKHIGNIKCLQDGSILLTGSLYNGEPSYKGWILKTNQNGDSLWYREYSQLNADDSHNYLYDFTLTEDKNIVTCGYVSPVIPDTGNDDTWIMKLDSIGCDTPNCDPTVIMPIEIASRGLVEVFPNPAREQFVVGSSLFVENDCLIQLFDLYGREAKEIKVPKGEEQIIIDTEGWQRGLYLVRVYSGEGFSEGVKVVVE
ncbi:MAG: T9SS type A sorting domain-containing protein [Bacteroidales bacterium]|nr:T9SS type A sorting domain-containing protein [Bacteroidales bacterium]MCF8345023.1 T9SS type A sorting domain-containing protein [Bacteroidales bacterium]MCF8352487.1 T9SS type A sorting domain-containing protein [Bacteroidales bacterium]MCF8377904.1 T9SS type A sorting domain-containing protein [Bacteroidales bacterium]MCF8402286.1 T9SS type A sorting domain-containing protein [Bacteroidales bacterium]